MLHVTNGESVIQSFREAQLPGSYVPWLDVLHDGGVPPAPTLEGLSDVRAQVLAQLGWGSYGEIRSAFDARDTALAEFRRHDEVVLWFEHDLLDQLQLVQVLDWFSVQDPGSLRLSIIEINTHPQVRPFYGLGQLSGHQLLELVPARKPVTAKRLAAARQVWQAFRAPEPVSLFELTRREIPEMPFLRAALLRFFEEYPSVSDGLSRMQRQIVRTVASRSNSAQGIYKSSQEAEQCPWGDLSVYWRIESLASGPAPALDRTSDGAYAITPHGRQVLAGKSDWVRSCGGVDVWLGGVHLSGEDAQWRWDPNGQTLKQPV